MPGRMQGRVALVTGGGGGIGEATGRLFVEEGAAVALVDASSDAVQAAAKGIEAANPGARMLPLVADLAQEAQARRAVADTVAHYGALHCLVNVAGIRVYQPLAQATAEDWEHILKVNVLATAYCCTAAIPALRAAGGGTIVNVSSVYGVLGRKGMGHYCQWPGHGRAGDNRAGGRVAKGRSLQLEIVAHDRPGRHVAGRRLEAGDVDFASRG